MMKKIIAMVLALSLSLAFALPSFALDEPSSYHSDGTSSVELDALDLSELVIVDEDGVGDSAALAASGASTYASNPLSSVTLADVFQLQFPSSSSNSHYGETTMTASEWQSFWTGHTTLSTGYRYIVSDSDGKLYSCVFYLNNYNYTSTDTGLVNPYRYWSVIVFYVDGVKKRQLFRVE